MLFVATNAKAAWLRLLNSAALRNQALRSQHSSIWLSWFRKAVLGHLSALVTVFVFQYGGLPQMYVSPFVLEIDLDLIERSLEKIILD